MKENVRRHIVSMIDGRPETVVLADRLLTSSEYERIRESAEELEEELPFEEELRIDLTGSDISAAI
ncbi:MAG: hypothetical protein OSB19_09120 [Opitutaceae bacterium]|nr:hypothetical protein [Opitutaceae bacterium]